MQDTSASEPLASQELLAIYKMNEFPRKHFYVLFGEFVHLHILKFSYSNPYFTLILCSFSSSGFAPIHKNKKVELACTRSTGTPEI